MVTTKSSAASSLCSEGMDLFLLLMVVDLLLVQESGQRKARATLMRVPSSRAVKIVQIPRLFSWAPYVRRDS
ncbi:hypothetical protein GLUCORHAEAF1_14755 [Komagataeibacter rhaeticus AF1]|nr:hypothetical protein GLUCORHAEAF1_14755 [Komagataeibacter rhaeticus AF1]